MLLDQTGGVLAGRTDTSQQEIAIARVAEVLPHAPGIRQHLQKLLASSAFRGSHRSQEFLKYVVEGALRGQCEQLKERTLGIALFGRDPSYDTGEDAIVRVTASDVRKRLLHFYSEAGAGCDFRIELPPGSYIPEFHHATFRELAPLAIEDGTKLQDSQAPRLHAIAWITTATILTLALGWIGGARFGSRAIVVTRDSVSNLEEISFYRELLGPMAVDTRMETDLVLSNPHVLVYVGSPAAKPPYENMNDSVPVPSALEKQLNPGANDVQASYPHHYLILCNDDYTGMGEANAAIYLARLFQAFGRPVGVTQARFLNWDTARKQHLILLGAPHMSAWTQKSLDQVNFIMQHDAIRNISPLPGEQAIYQNRATNGSPEDYGLVWMTRTPSGSRLLLLAGLSSTGTAGVGDFLCDPQRMRPVYEKLKAATKSGRIPENWQVLLKIRARDDIPVDVSFVALRVY